jgi:hypothetical protein
MSHRKSYEAHVKQVGCKSAKQSADFQEALSACFSGWCRLF